MTARDRIIQVAGRIAKWAKHARNGKQEGYCYVEAPIFDPEQGEQSSEEPVRKLQHFGFRSAIPPGSETLIIACRCSASNKILAASDNLKYGPLNLQDGEVALYDQQGSLIKLASDGSLTITSKSGASATLAADGSITLQSKGGAQAVLAKDSVLVSITHLGGLGAPPAVTQNGPALNGGAAAIIFGTDLAFQLVCVVKPANGIPGLMAKVKFSQPFAQAPYPTISPASDVAATAPPVGMGGSVYCTATATDMSIFNMAATPAPAAYIFNVQVVS